ncbi:MAG: 1-(5-phosphoribosyl)-5-[(5-phosphoribosylamino)methylideneamino]imidazole-4-carboxamide isomerase, partial [Anaerolineae bacterium]
MRIWNIYPSIDLRRGRVVRLMQGDPDRETRYGDDPLYVACRWIDAGATWLHVVNLDGAFGEESQENQAALGRILAAGPQVQLGGGMRRLADIRRALNLGVSRVIVGTAAIENPAMVEAALTEFGAERVAVGIDVRQCWVCIHGWQRTTSMTALELARQWADRGVRWFVFTDVSHDGTGSGLNLDAAVELVHATGQQVIASGGVSSLADVEGAYRAGLSGIIIGRALYEGAIKLEE